MKGSGRHRVGANPVFARARFILVYTTFGTRRDAVTIGGRLVRERLAACANIFPIDSVYRWKGKVCHAREHGVFLKTRAARYPELERELRRLHPYEIPCIVALPVTRGFPPYLRWITDSTTDRGFGLDGGLQMADGSRITSGTRTRDPKRP